MILSVSRYQHRDIYPARQLCKLLPECVPHRGAITFLCITFFRLRMLKTLASCVSDLIDDSSFMARLTIP